MELPTYISSAWFWLSLRRVVARYQLCSLVPHSLTVLRRPPRLLTIRFSLYMCHVSNFLVTSLPLRRPASSCSYILYILRIPPSHPPPFLLCLAPLLLVLHRVLVAPSVLTHLVPWFIRSLSARCCYASPALRFPWRTVRLRGLHLFLAQLNYFVRPGLIFRVLLCFSTLPYT